MSSSLSSDIPDKPASLDKYLRRRESAFDLKSGTQAQIVWDKPENPSVTNTALVYLHGFRASHPEGKPVHRQLANKLGANLFLSRLSDHGVRHSHPLAKLSKQKLITSARFAFEIGRRIGKKVILVGTSTGGSLALYLAGKPGLQERISSLILYSPLIQFYGINNLLLTHRWVRMALGTLPGRKYLLKADSTTEAEDKIWNQQYALGGALALGGFVQEYMKESNFALVRCPTFIGYYRKSKKEQDHVVSVPAILKMARVLKDAAPAVELANFPEAGNHVICSSLLSKSVNRVAQKSLQFLKRHDCHYTS